MKVLGIESSCDETGVAIFDTAQGRLLAQALHSQIPLHAEYGGVVPELASRDHIRRLPRLLAQALDEAGLSAQALDAVAYTAGPGLAGALLVGASFAHAYARALGKPAIAIHHLEGHLLSALLAEPAPAFPFVALLVSGGHTQLMRVDGVGQYRLLGESVDDAAGEAFDKTAKMLGLPYPGGPQLAQLAEGGQGGRFKLPRPMLKDASLDFSFSGLKTAVREAIAAPDWKAEDAPALAADFQQAVIDVLLAKAERALRQCGCSQLVVAGGVGANRALRAQLSAAQAKQGRQVLYPPPELCTDNGAMIAFAAGLRLQAGRADVREAIAVHPRWPLEAVAT